jgi:ADP-heptose:LPS heptosyltransferase
MSLSEEREIARDCRFFLGDRPCVWHKSEGVVCRCQYYERVGERILIIKLDASGDVLRTTCLLPVMARKWPDAALTWITRRESVPLLEKNPYLTEIVPYGPDAVVHVASRVFDRVINLDAGKIPSGLATMARAKVKTGFFLHEDGHVQASSPEAEKWLNLGVFDDLKKANTRTYQETMCGILGLPTAGLAYVLDIDDEERGEARRHLSGLGLDLSHPILGIHTGGGQRWALKQWTEKGFVELIDLITEKAENGVQVLLLGGSSEKDRNARIASAVKKPVFDGGCDNPLRHFAGLIGHCRVLVSGDSLAMHVALAMGRRVVVLFGPTSSSEIDLFGQGEKIVPDLDCLVCYRVSCDIKPNCMESITAPTVFEAVSRQLDKSAGRG